MVESKTVTDIALEYGDKQLITGMKHAINVVKIARKYDADPVELLQKELEELEEKQNG